MGENSEKRQPKKKATPGSFKPGYDPRRRADGRSRYSRAIKLLARESCADAIAALRSIVMNPGSRDSDRIAAARELLDRGIGRPTVTVAGDPDRPLRLGPDRDMIALFRRLAGEVAEADEDMRQLEAAVGEAEVVPELPPHLRRPRGIVVVQEREKASELIYCLRCEHCDTHWEILAKERGITCPKCGLVQDVEEMRAHWLVHGRDASRADR